MAAIVKLPSGRWRAQVRRKGKYLTGTFLRKKDAEEWGLEIERNIDRGVLPNSPDPKSVRTFAKIIDLHIMDHQEVGKPIRRSKAAAALIIKKYVTYPTYNYERICYIIHIATKGSPS